MAVMEGIRFFYIVASVLLTPYFLKTTLYCLLPFFEYYPTHTHTHTSLSPPTPHPHCNFCCPVFQLNGWSCHIWCAIYIYTWIIWIYTCWALNLSIRRTLMCVLCHKASSLLRPDTLWFFTGTLIWYHTHRNSTIRGQPPVMCS